MNYSDAALRLLFLNIMSHSFFKLFFLPRAVRSRLVLTGLASRIPPFSTHRGAYLVNAGIFPRDCCRHSSYLAKVTETTIFH
jgi:hypothetical protein